MIIRATKKLINTSRIALVKNLEDKITNMPGEWYASTISLHQPGKLAIHFFHSPTFISIIVPGKSLNKAIPILKERTSALLKRVGFSKLEDLYGLDSETYIYATNNKRILGYINQVKQNIEIHCARATSAESINYDYLEDIHYKCVFSNKLSPRGYFTPKDELIVLVKNNINPSANTVGIINKLVTVFADYTPCLP